MLNMDADVYFFGRSHIENVNSWQKVTDTIVFLEEPAVRLCKKVRSKWSGNWMKLNGEIVIIKRSGEDGSKYPMLENVCSFGRQLGSEIRIQLPSVELVHCQLETTSNGAVTIRHLGKESATFVNGQLLSDVALIHHNDVISIADRSFRFEYPRGHSLRTATPCKEVAVVKPVSRRSVHFKSPSTGSPTLSNSVNKENGTPTATDAPDAIKSSNKTPPVRGRKSSLGLSTSSNAIEEERQPSNSAERRSTSKSPRQGSSSSDEWFTPKDEAREVMVFTGSENNSRFLSAKKSVRSSIGSKRKMPSSVSSKAAKSPFVLDFSSLPSVTDSPGKSLTPARRFLLAKQVEEFSASVSSKKPATNEPQLKASFWQKRKSSLSFYGGATSIANSPAENIARRSSAGKSKSTPASGEKPATAVSRKSKTPTSATRAKTTPGSGKTGSHQKQSAEKRRSSAAKSAVDRGSCSTSSGKKGRQSKSMTPTLAPSVNAGSASKKTTPKMATPRTRLLDTPSPPKVVGLPETDSDTVTSDNVGGKIPLADLRAVSLGKKFGENEGRKRKSEVDAFVMPLPKRKRVSFGPNLSPERFDLWMPTSSPLKRGATPKRLGTPRPPLPVKNRLSEDVEDIETEDVEDIETEDVEDIETEDVDASLQSQSATPTKPAPPALVSPSPVVTTPTTPVKEQVVLEYADSNPLPGNRSPLVELIAKRTPAVEMAVNTSPVASFYSKRTPLSLGKTVDKVPAVKHWLNSITPPSVALATETVVIAASSGRKTTPASGGERRKSTQRAAAVSPVLGDGASVKTPTSQDRKQLSGESANVGADKTPASVARRTPAAKLAASALKSTARKSSAARAVIRSAVRKSVARSAVKRTKPLWSEVLKNRRSVGIKAAATNGKTTAAGVRRIAKKRIVATKAKTPAKRPSHLTTGHALSPSPLVIGRVKSLVTDTATVNKRKSITKISDDVELPSTPEGPGEMALSPWLGSASGSKTLSAQTTSPSASRQSGKSVTTPLSSRKRRSTSAPHPASASQDLSTPRLLSEKAHVDCSADDEHVVSVLSSSNVAASPALDGIKGLFRTPRAQKPLTAQSPQLDGISHLLKTSHQKGTNNDTASPRLDGLQRMLKTPRQKTVTDQSPALDGLKRMMQTPKQKTVAPESPALDGIKYMMKTPRQVKTMQSPQLDGLKELLATPAVATNNAKVSTVTVPKRRPSPPSPRLAGIKRLYERTSPAHLADLSGVAQLFQSPPTAAASPVVVLAEKPAAAGRGRRKQQLPAPPTVDHDEAVADAAITVVARARRGIKVVEDKATVDKHAVDLPPLVEPTESKMRRSRKPATGVERAVDEVPQHRATKDKTATVTASEANANNSEMPVDVVSSVASVRSSRMSRAAVSKQPADIHVAEQLSQSKKAAKVAKNRVSAAVQPEATTADVAIVESVASPPKAEKRVKATKVTKAALLSTPARPATKDMSIYDMDDDIEDYIVFAVPVAPPPPTVKRVPRDRLKSVHFHSPVVKSPAVFVRSTKSNLKQQLPVLPSDAVIVQPVAAIDAPTPDQSVRTADANKNVEISVSNVGRKRRVSRAAVVKEEMATVVAQSPPKAAKRRGQATEVAAEAPVATADVAAVVAQSPPKAAKRRGRATEVAIEAPVATSDVVVVAQSPPKMAKRRGRATEVATETPQTEAVAAEEIAVVVAPSPPKKARRRGPASEVMVEKVPETAVIAAETKRGRRATASRMQQEESSTVPAPPSDSESQPPVKTVRRKQPKAAEPASEVPKISEVASSAEVPVRRGRKAASKTTAAAEAKEETKTDIKSPPNRRQTRSKK